jgi:hypothetical protein
LFLWLLMSPISFTFLCLPLTEVIQINSATSSLLGTQDTLSHLYSKCTYRGRHMTKWIYRHKTVTENVVSNTWTQKREKIILSGQWKKTKAIKYGHFEQDPWRLRDKEWQVWHLCVEYRGSVSGAEARGEMRTASRLFKPCENPSPTGPQGETSTVAALCFLHPLILIQ